MTSPLGTSDKSTCFCKIFTIRTSKFIMQSAVNSKKQIKLCFISMVLLSGQKLYLGWDHYYFLYDLISYDEP